jgi:transaldolase
MGSRWLFFVLTQKENMGKKNQYLHAINEVGQSIWYDNLSLEVLQNGELEQLVAAGVSGLTSNPTIFKKAIADSSHYDEKIQALAKEKLSTEELCESLMVDDVGAAADLLLDTYQRTRGADGYASIEVSPTLADDTAGTVAAAERLWKTLDRPNVMIKIPATEAGVDAIAQVLSKGINVNVTLIFSCDVYRDVVSAYLKGISELSDEKKRGISSVASFFISRVDSSIEKEIEKKGLSDDAKAQSLIGKVGIANSKIAYKHFMEVFYGETFAESRSAGVPVQRPLWASTGTKNPSFHPLLYVEELAGKDTVNTIPPATLNELLQEATILPKLEQGLQEAEETMECVGELGIDLPAMLKTLQVDGVAAFATSYQELLDAVAKKQETLQKS